MSLVNDPEEIMRVRRMLGDAAEMKAVAIANELKTSSAVNKVFTKYTQIESVTGVWASTDPDHASTNYYEGGEAGGSFNSYTGEITLGTSLPGDNVRVLINYTYFKGLPDETIDIMVTNGKTYVEWYTNEIFDWTATTDRRVMLAIGAMTWRAATGSLIYMYSPDIMQKGFNWAIGEFRVESKTWAGSMGIRDLLTLWDSETNRYLAMLGKYEYFAIASSADPLEPYYRSAGRSYHGYRMDDEGDVH